MGAQPVVEPWEHETTERPPDPAPLERFSGDYTTFFRREVRSLVALAAAIADGDLDRRDLAGRRRRDLHRRLVGLQDDERVFGGDLVAHRNQHLDHRHVVEVPDVRDEHLFRSHALPHTRHGAGRSGSMS